MGWIRPPVAMKQVYSKSTVTIPDGVNFIGQKVKFHVDALEGVKVERDGKANTEILISGNSIDNVSRTCALIGQSCAVKKKDIRKFLDGIYVSDKGNIEN